jgi:ribonucleotide monophosphatase NagD (HAD superfamily)
MAIGGVLFDIDGVLVTLAAHPRRRRRAAGAGRQQIAAAYLTNTTTRTRGQIAAALTTAGMTVRPDEVITAAALTADYVRTTYPDARCFLVNTVTSPTTCPASTSSTRWPSPTAGCRRPRTLCCSAGPGPSTATSR